MGLPYNYCRNFVGQAVVAQCVGGRRYYGVVESVYSDHIVLRGIDPGAVPVKGKSKKLKARGSSKSQKPEFQPVSYYGYGPYGGYGGYYVLPLYVLLALSLFWI
ncbi:hypothetical protein [Ammoniphilus sp. 3BR4]|uniref:hypothetical protein n=1 Tax=Ammoniphilus sp. 3BR4 TaxID=3158265 RepID=UPI003466728A